MITSYAAGYAVIWYVTESTGSALVLAVMNICVMLPIGMMIFGPLSAVFPLMTYEDKTRRGSFVTFCYCLASRACHSHSDS